MERNAIMQRVMMLSEMWMEALRQYPNVITFAWVGSSSVEFKTIKGFVMFQTSYEKTLQDTILCLAQPFEPEIQSYGARIIGDLQHYFNEWNKDPALTETTGLIQWQPTAWAENISESEWFIENLNLLALALKISADDEKLVLALFPSTLNDVKAFSNWIELLMNEKIDPHIRIMLYESRDSMYFESLSKKRSNQFKYLYPDLDIAGAMDQILEDTKAAKTSPEEREMVSFQQSLIKMNEAIGYGDEEQVLFYSDNCLKIAQKYGWAAQQALVHFFEHTFYASVNKPKEAHHSIDKAITIVQSEENNIKDQTPYQYYIAKGNLYFMSSKFEEAAAVYKNCLTLNGNENNTLLLAGIYQMLGNSLRKSASKEEARNCFITGWELLAQDQQMELKDNAMAMFYAKDMLSVADQAMLNKYHPVMDELWGQNWRNNLDNQYKVLTKAN
jgi:tetratricopeptide (TPR) repeat protein